MKRDEKKFEKRRNQRERIHGDSILVLAPCASSKLGGVL